MELSSSGFEAQTLCMLEAALAHSDEQKIGLSGRTLMLLSAGSSALLLVGLVLIYLLYRSNLALAQGADSLVDVFTAIALGWALRVSLEPPDENHPFGHHNAQPIAALFVAILAGVLAVEVMHRAFDALSGDAPQPTMAWPVAGIFGAKVASRAWIAHLAGKKHFRNAPVLRALGVDARNDTLVGLLALGGFFGARYGMPTLDMWLAFPVALWVGFSGAELAWHNIRLLMGEAPPEQRQRELREVARSFPGVRRVHQMKVRYHGEHLAMWMEIHVDAGLTVRKAHDIGEKLEGRLLEEMDVGECTIHVDSDETPVPTSSLFN